MTDAWDDARLLAAFEDRTLPIEQWNHRAHVRVAFLYATQHPLAEATARMRAGIRAYNAAHEVPEALDRGYHETITVAFMRLIHAAASKTDVGTSGVFCDAHPELMDRLVLRRYYSRERIMTAEAKAAFVAPDLAPLG